MPANGRRDLIRRLKVNRNCCYNFAAHLHKAVTLGNISKIAKKKMLIMTVDYPAQ